MSISKKLKETLRLQAGFACEFCGVTETDMGGLLTIDHYRPRKKGGTDDFENLLYCRFSCNFFKHDYYPLSPSGPLLWNPRLETSAVHFLELESGFLYPLTSIGVFTLDRLRLNRPALVAHRLQKRHAQIEHHRLNRYRELTDMLQHVNLLLNDRLTEQTHLLLEQQKLMHLLLEKFGKR